MHLEIYTQAVANYAILVVPVTLICNDRNPISVLEIFGFSLWVLSYGYEAVADNQKLAFSLKMAKEGKKNEVCNVGLWRYCRHPNYFGEWMVWNSIGLTSLQSIANLNIGIEQKACLVVIVVTLSYLMWVCLTVWTGAKPAEFFSVQKRPDYKKYQETTNMIIPWFPKPYKF